MEVYLFGCKDTSLHISKFLNRQGVDINLITIDVELAKKNEVAGYINLQDFPQYFKSIYVAKSYSLKDSNDINYFTKQANCSLGFCIGWQRLIPPSVLDNFNFGILGMHGSARDLPFGKGRSPMNWSIIEGRKFFHTNLFRYQAGIDNGPVLDKAIFSINSSDTAETMHFKNVVAMTDLINRNISKLFSNNAQYKNQTTDKAETFYPKRSPADGIIDWSDDIYNMERLIRAVAPPFYGAIGIINRNEIIISRASIFYTDVETHPFLEYSHGEILEIFPNNKFLVRCSNGVLLVHEYEGENFDLGDSFELKESPYVNFERNVHGFVDT